MSPILLCSYGGVHIRAILPIWQRLNDLGINTVLLPLTSAILDIPHQHSSIHQLREFLCKDIQLEIDSIGEMMLDNEVHYKLPTLDSITYLGWSMHDLIKKVGNQKAKNLYLKYGRSCFAQESIAQDILRKLKPRAVITTNSPRLELALSLKAREFNIPSFVVNTDPLGTNNVDTLVRESEFSKIYVWGDFAKRNLISAGAASDNIYSFGLPHYDYLSFVSLDVIRKKIRAKLEINSSDNLGIWFTAQNSIGNIFPHEEFERVLMQSACNLNILIGTRAHPHHNYKPLAIDFSKFSLVESIAACDFIISTGSTVLIEALHLRKPIVFIDFGTKSNIKLPFHKTDLISNILQPLNADNSVSKKNIDKALVRLGTNISDPDKLPRVGRSTQMIVENIIRHLNDQSD